MERVTGIGGFFFRARDPDALGRWYAAHLGVTLPPPTYDDAVWQQEAGPTIWGAFSGDSEDFGHPAPIWTINFRVRNLDAMVDQLRGAGVAVEVDPEEYPNGRFARTADPEANPIQLWQPNEGAMPESKEQP